MRSDWIKTENTVNTNHRQTLSYLQEHLNKNQMGKQSALLQSAALKPEPSGIRGAGKRLLIVSSNVLKKKDFVLTDVTEKGKGVGEQHGIQHLLDPDIWKQIQTFKWIQGTLYKKYLLRTKF